MGDGKMLEHIKKREWIAELRSVTDGDLKILETEEESKLEDIRQELLIRGK